MLFKGLFHQGTIMPRRIVSINMRYISIHLRNNYLFIYYLFIYYLFIVYLLFIICLLIICLLIICLLIIVYLFIFVYWLLMICLFTYNEYYFASKLINELASQKCRKSQQQAYNSRNDLSSIIILGSRMFPLDYLGRIEENSIDAWQLLDDRQRES